MLEEHPSGKDLESFLKGASGPSTRALNARVMRHLLSECTICRGRLQALGWDGKRLARLVETVEEGVPAPAANSFDYSRAFAAAERAVSAFLTADRPEAEIPSAVLARLEGLPEEEQIRRVSAGGSFANPGIVRALIDRSHSFRFQDAEAMLLSANLARLAAESCPAAAGNELRLADLKARAWGQYGNALRVSGRPTEAEQAFAAAHQYRKAGTGDPMLRAWLLEKGTPLATFQGLLNKAMDMAGRAGEIYQELGENHLLASTLIQKATAAVYSGETESAVRMLNKAIPLIDFEEDPHLLLAACHNLIRCYIDLDQPEQALVIYSEICELYQEFDDPLIRLRAAWQEGQILRDLGHLRAAETALLRAREGYLARKLVYEAALVSLELATVYVKLGLVDELKSTVTATIPIFHALRVKLETLASLLQLRQVADQEQQALELIRILSAQIEPLPKSRVIESGGDPRR
jgi:tetratricopeptide (TPR) repeat protein